jgi:hypothetical protein
MLIGRNPTTTDYTAPCHYPAGFAQAAQIVVIVIVILIVVIALVASGFTTPCFSS